MNQAGELVSINVYREADPLNLDNLSERNPEQPVSCAIFHFNEMA